ncbi:MAG: YwaF family protein [Coprococcus sp.]|nr:YwaF family protein [Coprococcus sp.]
MSFFEYLLRLTSWPMTPPVLYGPFHLIAAFGGSAIAILAAWRFSSINNCNTNNRDNRRSFDQIMLVSGVILLIGELYKQLMNFYIVNNHAYDWWIFPFQLCSLPLYLCPLLILIHNEKRHRILCTFLLDFNMMGAVATFIDPSGIFHPYWTLTLHGVLWHLMLIFVGFVIIFSRKADLTTKGFLRTLPLFAFFCLAAEVLNSILHRFSAANLFYISPWEMSTQLLFGDIDRTLGRPVGILLYILAMIAGAWLIHNTARKITDVVSTSAPHQHAPH